MSAIPVPKLQEPVYEELQSILQWHTELWFWYAQAMWVGGWFVPVVGRC